MMRRGLTRWMTALGVVTALGSMTVLGGCGSPEPTLYTIAPVPGAAQPGGPHAIVLQQIGLARYLERSEIVKSSENYRLELLSNNWWGEPLSAMLSRVLIEELGQRLPHSVVFAELGAVSTSPDAVVELNLQRLDEDAAGTLVLQAQASVSFKGQTTRTLRSFRLTATPSAPDVRGEVAATSVAVGQLADGLAAMLRAPPSPH